MNIVIDARWIFREISGIGNYTRQLLREFARLPATRSDAITVLFNDPELEARTLDQTGMAAAPHMQSCRVPWSIFSARNQLFLPAFLKQRRIDLFHSPNYMIPFGAFQRHAHGSLRCVSTIHDLIPLRFPDHAPKSRKTRLLPVFRAVLRESARRSAQIITVSKASRDDIVNYLHVSPQRVSVVYNGVAENFIGNESLPAGPHADDIRTLLYVGRCDPYKNIMTLLHALDRLRRREGMNVRLRIAGTPDPRYPEPEALTRSLGLAEVVQWAGYLPDGELIEAYRQADILVHPSRYEGFGLQIAEAMACGTPVVCSNAGALPEVAGTAASLVAPDDIEAYVREIKAILTDPALARQMREAGLQQAARFSWTATARQTLDVYHQAFSSGGPPSS